MEIGQFEAMLRHATKMPTDDEMQETSRKWLSRLEGLTFESWNQKLNDLSYPTFSIHLERSLIKSLLHAYDCKDRDLAKNVFKLIDDKIQTLLDSLNFESGYFAKLTSRSAKDFTADPQNSYKPGPQFNAEEIVTGLLKSTRTFEDLCYFSHIEEGCHLHIRKYEDFQPSEEWRVFVKDKKIIGISQYYYNEKFNYAQAYINCVKMFMFSFVNEQIIPNIQIDSFIADIVYSQGEMKLLETNPFGLSDPCLFRNYQSFDGSFRYNK